MKRVLKVFSLFKQRIDHSNIALNEKITFRQNWFLLNSKAIMIDKIVIRIKTCHYYRIIDVKRVGPFLKPPNLKWIFIKE